MNLLSFENQSIKLRFVDLVICHVVSIVAESFTHSAAVIIIIIIIIIIMMMVMMMMIIIIIITMIFNEGSNSSRRFSLEPS